MSETSILPIGWTVASISEITTSIGGGTPPTADPTYWEGGAMPWVSPKDMKVFRIRQTIDSVTDRALGRLSVVPPNSVLVVVRSGILAHSLPIAVNDRSVVLNQDMRAFVPHAEVNAAFIAWQLLAFSRDILEGCTKDGTTVASIEGPRLAAFKLKLAPAHEQGRIVEAIESLLSALGGGTRDLEIARRKLALYRQSLLKSAVEGALTADARRSRSTAPDLELIPAGWTRVSIAKLTSLVTSGSRGWAEHYADDGAVFIRSQDINRDTLNLSACAHVSPPKGGEGTRTRVRKDDVLLTITGANVGKCALVTVSLEEAYVSQHVALIRLREPTLARHVHMYMVAEAGGRGRLDKLAYGAGKPGLNLEQVRTLDVPLPPSWEIELISQRIESLMEALNRLQSEIDQQLHLASNQRQNILRAAFSGQLVPQDPNDEPASVLLERIRAERPALAAAPKARRPRTAKERA